MDSKIILSLVGAVVLGFIGIMMMPAERDDGGVRVPWQVSVDAQGRTRVFGLTIAKTRLADIRDAFQEEGEINLFSHQKRADRYSAEAYFDQIYLNGLRADFIFSIDADQTELKPMYERGLRISQLGSGDKKIRLAPEDIEALVLRPISAITYLPWKSLDAKILRDRFGEPRRMLTEKTGVTHWLYPEKGMDIGMDKDGGVVIQYVNPRDFGDLIAPLPASSNSSEPTQ